MTTSLAETPLCDQFWDVLLHYNDSCRLELYKFQLVARKLRSNEYRENNSLISSIESLIQKVETLSIFSRQDTLDDIPSSSVKFLLLPFILAQCLENNQDLSLRRDYLLRAKKFYGLFCVTTLSLLHECDPEYSYLSRMWECYSYKEEDEVAIDPAIKRRQTIDRRTKINSYSELIIEEKGLRQLPLDEASERTCFVALLKQSLLEAIISCELIDQEVELLKERSERELINSDRVAETTDLDLRLDGANQAELKRYFQSRVFQPSHILPSISLKEAAEHDMSVELDLQEAQKRTLIPVEEDEDTREVRCEEQWVWKLVHFVQRKQRAWDDWKDDNPRGSGNKMTNRG